jgi:hypothetical protein
MTTQKNCSLMAAAYTLGVDADALERFVNHHRPLPGRNTSQEDSPFKVGDEMALLLDSVNPALAQRWRIANYLHHKKPVSR